MSQFVLDNSVTMRWILPSLKTQDQDYAEDVLYSLKSNQAQVPALWHLEVVNVLREAEKAKQLSHQQSLNFIKALDQLPISMSEDMHVKNSLHYVLSLSRNFKLSAYDASYLALSISLSLPIATLDKAMMKAARAADVDIYVI